ncbi:MAG: glycine--tRNA ligase subunit beta [Proteobacteria bacterium]|nr:glycine--tRNA ligase subunit beta [Pseudomonadota bacterium]
MPELLLELMSEEIPARMQTRAADDLRRLVCDELGAAGLSFGPARAFAGPRRLTLVVDGIPAARADVSEERRGPRVGAPDQAVQGFLKGAGLASLDQAEKRDTGKGEFWFAVITKKGGPTADVLPGIIDSVMKALPWPKSMKWSSGTRLWVRPLQSVIALFDGKVLPGEVVLAGSMNPLRFGDTTRGHRFLSKGAVQVTGFADYVAKLEAAHVMVDAAERKATIREGAERLCAAARVTLKEDDGLLEEVAGLVEWPVPLIGTIDAQFMDVPPEVLIVSMKTHLRQFVTTRADGTLADRFVVIANTVARDGGKTIVEGNERVLRARLADAKFFWDQDRRVRLEERLASLKGIVFHARLGTQAERVQRIAALATAVADYVPGADKAEVMMAAELCKADLVSGMVGEFPELQGIMGRYYALHEKLPVAVAEAIGDHYAPAGPNDRCPSAPVSMAVALADKLDALTSFWSIGEKPTGSRDPYALRRAALGVIRIVVENRLRLPLRRFFDAADLLDFFADRLKVQMRDKGVRHDVIDAVFSLGNEDDLVRLLARVEALQSFLGTDAGKNLLTAYGRAANIVRAEERKDQTLAARIASVPDVALLELAEEKAVASALAEVERTVKPALQNEDFPAAMRALAGLRAPIDAFFDKVTVNVQDKPDLRLNRLKLLNQIRATMDRVADFSRIEG